MMLNLPSQKHSLFFYLSLLCVLRSISTFSVYRSYCYMLTLLQSNLFCCYCHCPCKWDVFIHYISQMVICIHESNSCLLTLYIHLTKSVLGRYFPLAHFTSIIAPVFDIVLRIWTYLLPLGKIFCPSINFWINIQKSLFLSFFPFTSSYLLSF